MKKGKLFIISGPSGTGKGSICKKLLEMDPNLRLSVSVTTRAPREGEVHGREYFFITAEEYQELLEGDGLLEHASVYGRTMYGTPREQVFRWMDEGLDVILEIDVQGAFQVRENYPECILIFILPPSMEELEARIRHRGSETEESLKARLGEAQHEIDLSDRYDHRVVNGDLEQAVTDVHEIINRERL
ncbi:MAG: guanylate kinase [Firmicutes bacterium]|nr:guanylate kinase [Bacillota bacterium]